MLYKTEPTIKLLLVVMLASRFKKTARPEITSKETHEHKILYFVFSVHPAENDNIELSVITTFIFYMIHHIICYERNKF